jgi:hypothetical protein
MSMDVEVRDGVGLLQMGDTLIVLWNEPATLARWHFQMKRMTTMIASRPQGILVLVVILAVNTLPDAAVREDMQATLRRLGARVRMLVAVPLGDSMMLSLMRTLIRGLLVVSGQSHRHRVTTSPSEGLRLLREKASAETPSFENLSKGAEELATALGLDTSVALDSFVPSGTFRASVPQ